ncbi:hypothetical protein LB467_11780 [Salegentibacter sp. JZCK2]|uniref:hypothetical protein n=1 Tax=Salegentibacter tibetensis TaxID=2873600 RepID=UPI001CCEB261|nr:hypothetical protein [Salegentibacter tibetensis]MBZ9730366.1 hypothetical protein [Salegentibacter tibetensis]
MKSFYNPIVAPCVFIICLLVGCRDDDPVDQLQEEEFLSAQIDGTDFMVDRSVGLISCQKYLNDYGGIDLQVNVETTSGEIMEFYIADYMGARNYMFSNNIFNKSWMRYGIVNPLGDWITVAENKQVQATFPYLEIIEDDGNYIKGNFEFEAHNPVDNSMKLISNGNFNFRVASELD